MSLQRVNWGSRSNTILRVHSQKSVGRSETPEPLDSDEELENMIYHMRTESDEMRELEDAILNEAGGMYVEERGGDQSPADGNSSSSSSSDDEDLLIRRRGRGRQRGRGQGRRGGGKRAAESRDAGFIFGGQSSSASSNRNTTAVNNGHPSDSHRGDAQLKVGAAGHSPTGAGGSRRNTASPSSSPAPVPLPSSSAATHHARNANTSPAASTESSQHGRGMPKNDGRKEDSGGSGPSNLDDGDLMMEDLDDMDMDFDEDTPVRQQAAVPSKPVDEATCKALREIVFGRATGRGFPPSWLEQGFVFNSSADRPGQEFGLIQFKGGPCGPIAAVQAHVLQHLLPNTRPPQSRLSTTAANWGAVKPAVVGDVLIEAIGTILARAAGFYKKQDQYSSKPAAVVALSGAPNRQIASSSKYECDGFTESLQLYTFHKEVDLRRFLGEGRAYSQLTDPTGFGVALLTYSAILSRGIRKTMTDASQLGMRQPFIGEHCYAAQELVNLLVTGGAYSNVFDGVRELDDIDPTTGKNTKLYGVPLRGGIGCLTLYEHYGYVECGRNLKEPVHPIWVVCSESHYSCFFSTNNACTAPESPGSPFQLYFYDALARHEELPEMIVDAGAGMEFDIEDGAPLEKVLRTKWKGASVEWVGEPVL